MSDNRAVKNGELHTGDYGIIGLSWTETGDIHVRLLNNMPTAEELLSAAQTLKEVAKWCLEQE